MLFANTIVIRRPHILIRCLHFLSQNHIVGSSLSYATPCEWMDGWRVGRKEGSLHEKHAYVHACHVREDFQDGRRIRELMLHD
jgi:hypothetical protein